MGATLVLVDLLDDVKQDVAAGDGTCEVVWDQVPPGMYWRVGLICLSTSSTPGTPPIGLVYIGEALTQNLRTGTDGANFDSFDTAWPIIVPSGRQLRIRWTGATPASRCTAAIQYELFQRMTLPADARPLLG